MSRDAHYATLNNRFDVRAALLFKMGFHYRHVPEWDIAVFARDRIGFSVPTTVPASLVMNADEIVWDDTIVRLAR